LKKIVVLAGGTGSAKLVRGLHNLPGIELSVICNVGDNFWWQGLYVCPDLDTITYALAGWLDRGRGWGVRRDTFRLLQQLRRLGHESWFRTGDLDLAVHVFRTRHMFQGLNLAEVTDLLRKRVGVAERIWPASNDEVQTRIRTGLAWINLQEYWVHRRGRPPVRDVYYDGAATARPDPGALRAVESADTVVISPANPVTSIGPMLALPTLRTALKRRRRSVVGVSPIIGRAPVSGPAGRLLRGLKAAVRPSTVAARYRDVLGRFVVHQTDQEELLVIAKLNVEARSANILMPDPASERRVARAVLDAAGG
jgi:LPPG:FO 2-phospho-L-lactate transferase